jgi:hypothetical protein
MVLPMCLKPVTSSIFKTWWIRLSCLKTKEELWNERERCSALDHKESTLDSVLVHHHKDLFSDLGNKVDSQECKLQVKDFKLLSDRFSTPISNLPTLHRHHRRGIIMHKIPVLWDHATVVVRVGTTLIGVQGSQQIRLQPQAQIRTSTAMATTVHLLR